MPRWKALPKELDPQVREFTSQLRALVNDSGMSIKSVADNTGYSMTSWQRYLNGRLLVPKNAVVALAEITGASPVHLTTMWDLAERAWSRSEMRHDSTAEAIRISQARAALGEFGPASADTLSTFVPELGKPTETASTSSARKPPKRRGRKPSAKRILIPIALVFATVGYVLLLWNGPWWIDGAHLRTKNLQPADGVVITGFRTMLVALGAGSVAGFGLWYTHKSHQHTELLFQHTLKKDREQADLAREGQVTERYVEAIKLLSSDSLTQRLGGIYSLERIMRDSEKDHTTVIDVLVSFIRQRTGVDSDDQLDDTDAKPDEDVQAALTVLGRRPNRTEGRGHINLRFTDLRGADMSDGMFNHVDLRNAWLQNANLAQSSLLNAIFQGAALKNADLTFAHLAGATFHGANMEGATLRLADAKEASFSHANLERANFRLAKLQNTKFLASRLPFADFHNADLGDADLGDAMLESADLSQTMGLTAEQLAAGLLHPSTMLPPGMDQMPSIRSKLDAVQRPVGNGDLEAAN
ncbi:pentapeptide repeat-containing protein [Streptomyces chartreusis]